MESAGLDNGFLVFLTLVIDEIGICQAKGPLLTSRES